VENLLDFRCEAAILLARTVRYPRSPGDWPVVTVGWHVNNPAVDVVRTSDDEGMRLAVNRQPSCFAVSVDQAPAAAQAARTARVSCGVACSGHGPRNLAAMMTRRSLMVMSS
jgi:hypothetical protein